MTIDWNAFTPGPALFGGLLIGLAAAMLAGMGLFEWLERRPASSDA
jgi:hypothetical protein